jgi:hypothetical protein
MPDLRGGIILAVNGWGCSGTRMKTSLERNETHDEAACKWSLFIIFPYKTDNLQCLFPFSARLSRSGMGKPAA